MRIWRYIADDNEKAADRLLDRFQDAANKLAVHPEAGRPRPELSDGLRSFMFTTGKGSRSSGFSADIWTSMRTISPREAVPHPISANRSTSTIPLSEIFRWGMTGNGRKATWRKGSSSVVPSA